MALSRARGALWACLIGFVMVATAARADGVSVVKPVEAGGCETCLWLVNALELYVEQPAHQQQLIELLLTDVCPSLPEPIKDQCTMMVPLFVPSLIIWIQENWSPSIVCADVGACASAAWTNFSNAPANKKALENGFECPMCKFLVMQLLQQAQDPASQASFMQRINEACDALPLENRADCHKAATDLGNDLIRLVQDVDPDSACIAVKACPAGPPSLLALLPPSLLALPTKLQALTAGVKDDNCDTCKIVVLEVAAVLASNETQAEIMVYLKEACGVFETFKDQCLVYVDMYAPLAFNILIQYMQPLPLCTQLGYCPPPTPPSFLARLYAALASLAQPTYVSSATS